VTKVIPFKYVPSLYYREWMQDCGAGVMLGYDVVEAKNRSRAKDFPAYNMYNQGKFTKIVRVKNKHRALSEVQLSTIYGMKPYEKKLKTTVRFAEIIAWILTFIILGVLLGLIGKNI